MAPGRSRCTGVRPYHGAVDTHIFQVSFDGDAGQHLLPRAKPAPTSEPFEHAVPMPEPVGQKLPLGACTQHPQHRPGKPAASGLASHPDAGRFLQPAN